jgi:hypothetical protein
MDTEIRGRRVVGNMHFEYGEEKMTGLGRSVVQNDLAIKN